IIHGNLVTAKLSDKPAYEALSYAWGHLVYCEKIYLPTSYLEITSNLATALRQLRHQDRPRKLWVDALCINQSDEAEKGHQVMLMAQIYSGTKSCLAWLGEANTETHAAVRTIRDLASKAWPQLDFKPINAFFKQAWFSRLWVVQEACL
ncbi:heterokaryon incompatibility, partial [Hyaloscypha variabilis F]